MSHLLNAKLLNTALLNGGVSSEEVLTTDSVAFENYSLNDGSSIVLTAYPLKGPAREVLGGAIPRGNGRYFTDAYFRETGILLRGYLKAASKAAMADLMDELCELLATEEGNLDIIEDNGVVKRYVATCVNWEEQFGDRERHHVTLVPFTLRFLCSAPFGKARTYDSYYATLTTSGNQSVVNGGTTEANPVAILIFTAASGVTAVQLSNATTGESITYTGSIAANDILEFDGERKRVYLNGVSVDYSGTFPRLKPGTNVLSYAVTGGSFQAGVTAKFKKQYVR